MATNSYDNLSYWFEDRIVDNNGVSVSDINAGLVKLIPGLIDDLNDTSNTHTRFVLNEEQEGMPDDVASRIYENQNLWWYICLANLLDNPFDEFKTSMIYYAFDGQYLTAHQVEQEASKQSKESKIGKIITLN
jgi:hypothetical protein